MLTLTTPRGTIPVRVFVSDLDRTLTDARLRPVPSALQALGTLRKHGVRTVLATGRTLRQLAQPDRLRQAFDALVLEGGALAERDGELAPGNAHSREIAHLRAWPEDHGIPFRSGASSLSLGRGAARRMASYPRRRGVAMHHNRDPIDVTVAGIDKQAGVRAALRPWRIPTGRGRLAFGDAENDLCLFRRAECSVAVRNALPCVRRQAEAVTERPAGRGVAESLTRHIAWGCGS